MNTDMTPLQTAMAARAAAFHTAVESWCCTGGRLRPLCMLAAIIVLVFSGCEVSDNREARKMDNINGDRRVAAADLVKQARALIPPIDLVESAQIETATFALG